MIKFSSFKWFADVSFCLQMGNTMYSEKSWDRKWKRLSG